MTKLFTALILTAFAFGAQAASHAGGAPMKDKAASAPAAAAKKVIGSMDDLDKERKALFSELGLDDTGYPKDPKEPIDKVADKLKAA
jgi:hypothetical protein